MDGFFGIDIARRALQVAQYGMDVTSHNIANANTAGYTRQRVIQGTTPSFPVPSANRPLLQGQLGSGVEVKRIERVRDSFFDGQIRKENLTLGDWEIKENALQQLETVFNEPSDAGLLNIMGEYWNAWQQLSKNPESLSARSTVLEKGAMLTDAFNQTYSKLTQVQENLDEQVSVKVDEVNSIAKRIASINQDILRVKSYGTEPNDLLDERDVLLDNLSKLIDAQYLHLETGVVLVNVNGMQLVSESSSEEMQVVADATNSGYNRVIWKFDGTDASIYGGEIKSLIETRDTIIPLKYKADLDTLAASLINEVNAVHNAGVGLDGIGMRNFFAGTGASDIAISSDVAESQYVAASLSGAAGDNSNALAIAQLKNALTMNGNSNTMDDYYRSIITNLGIESQEASRMVSNGKLYYDLIESHRQSVSGVSLDEEATNMIKYQRAYQAAARMITAFDEMLDVLINQMVR